MKRLTMGLSVMLALLLLTGCSSAPGIEEDSSALLVREYHMTELALDTPAETEAEPETESAAETETVPTPETEPVRELIPIVPPEESPLPEDTVTREAVPTASYVLNMNSKKIHRPDCSSVPTIAEKNLSYTDDFAGAIENGYTPCKVCNPTE